MHKARSRRVLAVAGLLTALEAAVVARRRGSLLSARTVVRCRRGHLYSTLWIPGVSVKALRFGWWRLQWCPVGRHWSLVTPARAGALRPDQMEAAGAIHDAPVP